MLRWIVSVFKAFARKFWGTAKKMAVAVTEAYSLGPEPATEKRTVIYWSRRHGLRVGEEIGRDNTGRVIIHLNGHPQGVRVRRQPHLLVPG